jgi:hypothetical protein
MTLLLSAAAPGTQGLTISGISSSKGSSSSIHARPCSSNRQQMPSVLPTWCSLLCCGSAWRSRSCMSTACCSLGGRHSTGTRDVSALWLQD